jgi:hypothetical protein
MSNQYSRSQIFCDAATQKERERCFNILLEAINEWESVPGAPIILCLVLEGCAKRISEVAKC